MKGKIKKIINRIKSNIKKIGMFISITMVVSGCTALAISIVLFLKPHLITSYTILNVDELYTTAISLYFLSAAGLFFGTIGIYHFGHNEKKEGVKHERARVYKPQKRTRLL